MLSLGLIGAGRWGRNYIKTISTLDGIRLARLASRNPASAGLAPPDCTISTDWRVLVEAGDLDGLIIATPPALHAEMATAALLAGLPVLIEKPLTLDAEQAHQLLRLAQEKRGRVMVDHTHLFHPAFEALRRQRQQLAATYAIRSVAGNHGPYRSDASVLWDWGSHDVAMCLDLAQSLPQHVSAVREATAVIDGAIAERIRLKLDFGASLQAEILISNMMDKKRWFAVYGEHGVLVYDDLAQHKLMQYEAASASVIPTGPGTAISIAAELPLQRVVQSFAALARNDEPDCSSLQFGVRVVEVLAQCAESLAASAE